MTVPDKIYITEYNANVETGYFSRNKDDVFTQEYIRKDIVDETIKTAEDHAYFAGQEKFREKLMVWLRYEKEWLGGTVIEPYYQKMIDILNSM